jgi:hypothetical protein
MPLFASHVVPTEFTIAIDHNERGRYCFEEHDKNPHKIVKLEAGHYSLVGWEQYIAVLRLTKESLFVACSFGRDQSLIDLGKLSQVHSGHLVIECSIDDIFNSPPPGDRTATKSVLGSIVAWSQRFSVTPWFCGDRDMGERTTWTLLDRWYRDNVLCEASTSTYRRARRQALEFLNPERE